MPTDAPVSLPDQAAQLRQAVERLRRLRDVGGTIDALNLRAAEARVVADVARPVAAGRALLAGRVATDLPAERLTAFRAAIAGALARADADSDAAVQLDAVDFAALRQMLEIGRDALVAAWRKHVTAPVEGEAMVPVLERFAPFRDAVERFRQARGRLQPLSDQLPTDAATLHRVTELRSELHAALKAVDAQGLDPEAADFLRRCLDGFPLPELLAKPALLAWLQSQGLMDSLRVRPA